MNLSFDELYERAKAAARLRRLSDWTKAGEVGAALLTDSGRVYVGASLDMACSVGFCAEHAAAAGMVTAGESRVVRMIAVAADGRILPPCGRCREFITQLDDRNLEAEVKVSASEVRTLRELLPHDWREAVEPRTA